MFTGIVEGTGKVLQVEERPGGRALRVEVGAFAARLRVGSSVALNGCCTTVVRKDDRSLPPNSWKSRCKRRIWAR